MVRKQRQGADLVIVNAEVWSMESPQEQWDDVTAVAVRGNTIVAVGGDEDVRATGDADTVVVDAGGRALIPGLVDAHTHFQVAAVQRHLYVDFSITRPRSIAEVLRAMSDRAATVAEGQWVRGDGLRYVELAEHRYPTRDELDAVSTTNPVIIVAQGHHAVSANSLALRLAGIDESTPDPAGGEIERDSAGRLNGVLLERGKLRLDPLASNTVVPTCTDQERRESLLAAFAHANSFGITAIHDVLADPLEVASYIGMKNDAMLGLRVSMLLRGVGTETKIPLDAMTNVGLIHGLGDDWLRFDGVKMSIDGAHTHRAAATHDAYLGAPGNFGAIRINQEDLDRAVGRCQEQGVRAIVHAIGPRAVDMACDAFDRAEARYGRKNLRHRIEHAYLSPPPGQLRRIADLGVTVSTQAAWIMDAAVLTDIFGPDGLTGIYSLRDMLDLAIPLLGGTDFPGVPIDPFTGIGFAVNRLADDGRVIDGKQAIGLWDSLAMCTRTPAWSSFQDHRLGTLSPGKLADLVLLDRPLRSTAPAELNGVQADLTVLDGRTVFDRHSEAG